MLLAAIFQVFEHLNDFQTIGYDSHYLFQKDAKVFHMHLFIAINIPRKFGEDIFINE